MKIVFKVINKIGYSAISKIHVKCYLEDVFKMAAILNRKWNWI